MSYIEDQELNYLKSIAESQKKSASRLWWIKWILLLPILLTLLWIILGLSGLAYLINYLY